MDWIELTKTYTVLFVQVAEVEGVLFAMGGNDGSSSLNSVEVFFNSTCFRDIIFRNAKIFQNDALLQYDIVLIENFHKMFIDAVSQ